jgi:TMEM175 potassium channel family protein
MDKGRFDAFSDGVFAIAITVLVLEIHIPDHLGDGGDASMRAYLATIGGSLLTYALSFMTVGTVWLNHHSTFVQVKFVDRTANLLNLVLLLIVCFLPYPTALLSRYGPLPSSTALYGATFTAMSLAYFAVWQYAIRLQAAYDPDAPRMRRSVMISGAIGTLFYVVGTLLAFVAPRVSVGIFVAVALYYMLPGLFNVRRGQGAARA